MFTRLLVFLMVLSFLGGCVKEKQEAGAADVLHDSFARGSSALNWAPFPFFPGDNLKVVEDATTPEGDGWVGVIANEREGGFAALSYVRNAHVKEFLLETWIYAYVTEAETGPLNGVAFGVDPAAGNFYRVVADFKAGGSMNLAYVGKDTNNYPVYLRTWQGQEIPGGLPRKSAWHKLKLVLRNNNLTVYWDDAVLPGGPLTIENPSGYVGVYANFVGGLGEAETRVDSFTITDY